MNNRNPILLNDILNLSAEELKTTKIRLNMKDSQNPADDDPLDLLKDNTEESYQKLLKRHYRKNINNVYQTGMTTIGFVELPERNLWILSHIGRITRELSSPDGQEEGGGGYEYEEIEKYKPYFARLIVDFDHACHNPVFYANKDKNYINEMHVHEILPEVLNNDEFPGYDVNVSWHELERFVKKTSWRTALENQKGVYLIVDSKTGKMYIGSAYGERMILQRWEAYLENGSGGNDELKNIVNDKTRGFEYIKNNFRYSILEIFSAKTEDAKIIERENWWKENLLTRQFGYNKN